jgi:lipoprotein-anchoring transpeptidase ErfK/SrfK
MNPGCALAAVACLLAPATAGAADGTGIAARQEIVRLLAPHTVRTAPDDGARVLTVVADLRPITSARTVLPALQQRPDDRGRSWLLVRLPGRALGGDPPPRTGWIRASKARRSATAWHLVVNVGARRVTVHHGGRRVRSFRAIVGAPSTPTPRGEYFVEENVRLPADRAGAPFALALSARSTVLQEFDGGPGQIAVHGRGNIGGELGTAVSHGCVRLADADIAWLAARIRPGVPVSIR